LPAWPQKEREYQKQQALVVPHQIETVLLMLQVVLQKEGLMFLMGLLQNQGLLSDQVVQLRIKMVQPLAEPDQMLEPARKESYFVQFEYFQTMNYQLPVLEREYQRKTQTFFQLTRT
jgi:hypothetical protein